MPRGGIMKLVNQGKPLNKVEKKQVKSIVNRTINTRSETKHYNTYDSGTAVQNVVSITDLCPITQSNADTGRDGDQLELYNFQMNYALEGGDATNIVRVMIFQWKDDSVPLDTDILFNIANVPWLSFTHVDKKQLFTVLYDRKHSLCLNGANGVQNHRIHLYGKKLGRKKIQYQGGTTTGMNKLYLLRVSDSAGLPDPFMYHHTRIQYKDL